MSTENPAQPARLVPLPEATEEESPDETTPLLLYVGGGVLILLAFLAFLCIGFYYLGVAVGGHPPTDIFLTPVP